MKMTSTFPGFDSPAVGFEQPFEMLLACHERVRRSLALLGRLVHHVDEHGHDEQSRSAASDVRRYFDLAAPLHHEDEERHVFPILADSGDGELAGAVSSLHRDHDRMSALWVARSLVAARRRRNCRSRVSPAVGRIRPDLRRASRNRGRSRVPCGP
jgi:hypothetical protein